MAKQEEPPKEPPPPVVIEGKAYRVDLNMRDFTRQFFPDATDKQAEDFLWECTPFPCVDASELPGYAHKMMKRSDGDIGKAFELSYADLDRGMAQFHQEVERTRAAITGRILQTGRANLDEIVEACKAMDIDPSYVDVALQDMQEDESVQVDVGGERPIYMIRKAQRHGP